MDEHILHMLSVGDSPEFQRHILTYFEELQKQDNGWQISGEVLAQNLYSDERVKFFCLQVMEAHIKTTYSGLNSEQKHAFKLYLQQWFKQCCSVEHKNFIRNKTAQLFCLIFIQEYPQKWLTFFNEILSLLEFGELAVDGYLRVLIAIDEEVVARHVPHSQNEFDRNTAIKDHMRDHCINDLVKSWYQILCLPDKQCAPAIKCLCLQVIGVYVSWIDINLIANDCFINKILELLSSEELREAACDCLQEIINKGMDSSGKTRLVESLANVLEKVGIMDIKKTDIDIEFLIKLSTLLNRMGVQLILSFNKLTKEETDTGMKIEILKAIDKKIVHMIRFLSDEDDDVSEGVFEFCHSYIGLLKQLNGCNPIANEGEHIKEILRVVIKKMKYDEDFNFDHEGDSEAEFIEFRKQMKVLLGNLAKLDGEVVMTIAHEIVNCTLSNWRNMTVHEIELAIYILYCLGEAFPGQVLYTDQSKSLLFQNMMSLLISSDVSHHGHHAITHQYFETVTRYERFFYSQNQHVPVVLMSFLDERGLQNHKASVCSRTSFLLMRFVKSLKNQVQPYIGEILKQIQTLLVNTKENGIVHTNLSENDKYYLYEVSAILITSSNNNPPEKQKEMMQTLLTPVIISFQQIIEKMTSGQLGDIETLNSAQKLLHLMSYASRASKAFSTSQSLKASGCTNCFTDALSIFLHALTIPVHRDIVHSGVRQYLHRMIICLGEEVLPFVPVAVNQLLKDCEMRDIQEFIPLINQLITRFKSGISPFLTEILMPLVTQIFALLQSPIENNDQQAVKEKQLLHRGYFLFITTICNMNVIEVISNQESGNVEKILLSIVHGAVELNDPQAQKTCFVICTKLVEKWGGDESFNGFIYDSIMPACFLAPLKPTFDLNDAQTYLALQEIATLQKTTLQKRNHELIQWLQQSYLPQNNCPAEIIQEYCMALQAMDNKTFKNYLKAFYSKWKT